MSLNIKNKRSAVQGSSPTAAQLQDGELGVNYNASDPAIYLKDSAGAVIRIAGAGSVGGGAVESVNSQTGVVVLDAGDVGAATSAQGSTADSALQPGNNVSELVNDAGYITSAIPEAPADGKTYGRKNTAWSEVTGGGAVDSVNGQTGVVVLDASDVGAATTAQGLLADSATQPNDNVSTLTNDAGYVPSDPTGVTGADSINNMMSLTQAEYDAIGTPDASTLYIITP